MPCPFALLLLVPYGLQKVVDGSVTAAVQRVAFQPRALEISFAVFLLATTVLVWMEMPFLASGEVLPDAQFGPSAADIEKWLSKVGEEGRANYATHALYDLGVYVAAYGGFLCVVLARLIRKFGYSSTSAAQYVLLLPVAGMVCDVLETGTFYWMTSSHPNLISSLIRPAVPVFNQAKWVFLAGALLAIVSFAISCGLDAVSKPADPVQKSEATKKTE
mmetsp:Transcript_28683/g.56346  ORF Transcript_28683/g.56346 Transcript_28683/m.56346 type:complete len:218 (-) Transcript_28683:1450-2103(-)|eukprot:CAMPEP_0175152098 /NCGR_PEP_ID=MMETSP0087-20121206/18910_1 /TAXON_ID=136419 /ORGANISM="Unknown Unknown, Strain D1" /LENGTH=217 /DNA_ID=CAMNT_0016438463 /DNA_START=35 /DNA_END=688 /DNA_ORIENTATION=+